MYVDDPVENKKPRLPSSRVGMPPEPSGSTRAAVCSAWMPRHDSPDNLGLLGSGSCPGCLHHSVTALVCPHTDRKQEHCKWMLFARHKPGVRI